MSEDFSRGSWWTRLREQLRNFDAMPQDRDHASLRYGTVIEGYGRALLTRVTGALDAARWRTTVEPDAAKREIDQRRAQALQKVAARIAAALDVLRGISPLVAPAQSGDGLPEALPGQPGAGTASEKAASPSASAIFSQILAAELSYFHLTDDADRFATARAARERFTRVASTNALAARNASEVPELKIPLSDAAVADTITLLNLIHARYLLDIARETESARQESILLFRLQRPVIIVGVLMLITVLVALVVRLARPLWVDGAEHEPLFVTQVPYFLVGLLLVVLFGYAGSVISVAQRAKDATSRPVLEGDPVSTIGGLAAGWNGVLLAMASASVFAGVAYILFASGIANLLGISGGLFPVPFGASECGSTGPDAVANTADTFLTGPAVNRLSHVMGFCGGVDYMKMLVIGFVAGFSERLVPDMLQQIAARTGTGQTRGPKEVDPDEFKAPPPSGAASAQRDGKKPDPTATKPSDPNE